MYTERDFLSHFPDFLTNNTLSAGRDPIMKMLPLYFLGFLMLLGCAETKYVKAGATEEDFETAKVECHDQILMSPTGTSIARAQMSSPGVRGVATQSASQTARRDVDDCLRAKGWVPISE